MFKVNFKDIASQLSPWFFRKSKYLKYLYALIRPLNDINDNGVPVSFFNQGSESTSYQGIYDATNGTYAIGNRILNEGIPYKNIVNITSPEAFDPSKWIKATDRSFYQLTEYLTRFLQVSSSRLVFQKYLNELWDSTNEGILIVNNPATNVNYKFNASEQHTTNYKHNAFDSAVDYVASGEFVLAPDGNVYESNTTPNIGNQPPNANWNLISTADEYLFNEADTYPVDYTIKIPVLVTMQPDYSDDRFKAIVNFFNASGRTYEGIKLETSEFLFSNT